MNAGKLENADDHLIYRVAQLFIASRKKTDDDAKKLSKTLAGFIADTISAEFPEARFTREMVWPFAGEAVRRGFLVLVPPFDLQMQQSLVAKYPHLADRLHVVRTANRLDNKKVSEAAAKIALDHVKKLAATLDGRPLGLGLGPGRATRDFCESFGRLMAGEQETLPKLDLIAITAGCPAKEPEHASISFFNFFEDRFVHGRTGLFAETLVSARDFPKIQKRAGVKEAFAARNSIHMVVTSMGDLNDEHDLLRVFLKESGVDVAALCKRGWLGNVQYRPYTSQGPIKEEKNDLRAVTLFELDDLAKMAARDDKRVILIARQCARCERTRASTLEPLLREDSKLRVFSDLVLDTETCRELVGQKAPKT